MMSPGSEISLGMEVIISVLATCNIQCKFNELKHCIITNISHDNVLASVLVIQRMNPTDFGETNVVMETDPLVLSVLQSYGVVSHTQQCDDEVDQSEDAVEPQKAVPARHKNMPVTCTSSPI